MSNLLLYAIIIIGVLNMACSSKRPASVGIVDNKLNLCPDSPNCVSSFENKNDSKHYIEPLNYSGDLRKAMVKLEKIIRELKNSKIVKKDKRYLHVEFSSALFSFVDDVEFLFNDKKKIIHVRSASRIGYSDLGVNRKRINKIRSLFNK
jgi:uncharacterized protein (DUF1499 family)